VVLRQSGAGLEVFWHFFRGVVPALSAGPTVPLTTRDPTSALWVPLRQSLDADTWHPIFIRALRYISTAVAAPK
jgi:hypothetical protein